MLRHEAVYCIHKVKKRITLVNSLTKLLETCIDVRLPALGSFNFTLGCVVTICYLFTSRKGERKRTNGGEKQSQS